MNFNLYGNWPFNCGKIVDLSGKKLLMKHTFRYNIGDTELKI